MPVSGAITLLLAVFLAHLLILSGSATLQLLNPSAGEDGLTQLGFSKVLTKVLLVALPIFELYLSIALLNPAWTRSAMLIAGILYGVYAAALVFALSRGKRFVCHCFGAASRRPISWWTTLRCVVCMLTAIGAASTSKPTVGQAVQLIYNHPVISGASFAYLLLLGAVVFLAMLLWNLVREQSAALARLRDVEDVLVQSGLGVREIPEFSPPARSAPANLPRCEVRRFDGAVVLLSPLGNRRLLLIFADMDCAGCLTLIPEAAGWMARSETIVHLISEGPREVFDGFGFSHEDFLYDDGGSVARALKIQNKPAALLVEPNGSILSDMAVGPRSIRKLFDRASSPLHEVEGRESVQKSGNSAVRAGAGDLAGHEVPSA